MNIRRHARLLAGVAAVTVTVTGVAALPMTWADPARKPAAPPEGVVTFERPLPKEHVDGAVAYEVIPPVGGPHGEVWQNCGFYGDWETWPGTASSSPVVTEAAVHSLEHGAVWITYDATAMSGADILVLRRLAHRPYVLVSPWPDPAELPSPVVASAWGVQIHLDGVDDPRLEEFTEYYRQHADAPEPEGACHGGIGRTGAADDR